MISMNVSDGATPYLESSIDKTILTLAGNLLNAANLLLSEFKKATSPSPNYSLAQLRSMGHPYGKLPPRPGTKPREPIPHTPMWLINRQTAQLHSDLAVSPIMVTPDWFLIQIGLKKDSPAERYAHHVIYGTRKMVGRNFMINSMFDNFGPIKELVFRSFVQA